MPKPNTYVQLLNAQKEIAQLRQNIEILKGFTVQQCLDIAIIALHEEFQFGPKYSKRFEDAFLNAFLEYAEMCVSDGADDPEIVYTKEKLDRGLRAACGDNIRSFDERYDLDNLYFRNKLKTKKSADHVGGVTK